MWMNDGHGCRQSGMLRAAWTPKTRLAVTHWRDVQPPTESGDERRPPAMRIPRRTRQSDRGGLREVAQRHARPWHEDGLPGGFDVVGVRGRALVLIAQVSDEAWAHETDWRMDEQVHAGAVEVVRNREWGCESSAESAEWSIVIAQCSVRDPFDTEQSANAP